MRSDHSPEKTARRIYFTLGQSDNFGKMSLEKLFKAQTKATLTCREFLKVCLLLLLEIVHWWVNTETEFQLLVLKLLHF